MSVVSKTTETNAVRPYFVSRLAGPRIAGRRAEKGDELLLTEHQARALLLSGELVDSEAKVDDPFGEAAAAKEREDAAAKAAADQKAHDAQAAAAAEVPRIAAEKAVADAASGQHGDDARHDDGAHHDDAHG